MESLTGAAVTLGVVRSSWDRRIDSTLKPALLLVLGGWVLMAWSRFGAQGLTSPRAGVRFVLIGFYGWVALAVLVWLLGRYATNRFGSTLDRGPDGTLEPPSAGAAEARPEPNLVRIAQFTGLAHRPVIIFGFALQFAAVLLRMEGPGLVAAALVLGLWMPAMLLAAVRSAFGLSARWAGAVVGPPYLLWLATVGRHLVGQIEHLL